MDFEEVYYLVQFWPFRKTLESLDDSLYLERAIERTMLGVIFARHNQKCANSLKNHNYGHSSKNLQAETASRSYCSKY